jgi:putative acetyltransferase
MIRPFEKNDLDQVMDIWLEANLDAHDFIPAEYWKKNFDAVRAMIPAADVTVSADDDTGAVNGFIGMTGDFIEGIFVSSDERSHGIGKILLDYVKKSHPVLRLEVYEKNTRAFDFYIREGFSVLSEDTDHDTGEKEYLMECKITDLQP